MRRVWAGAVAMAALLAGGLVLAGEPVDWSKVFEKRAGRDFDWSLVANRTISQPVGPVDWWEVFGKKAPGAKPADNAADQAASGAREEPEPGPEAIAPPRAAKKPAVPVQNLTEPAPDKPAAPARPARAPTRSEAPAIPEEAGHGRPVAAPDSGLAPAASQPAPAPAPSPAAPSAPPAREAAPAPPAREAAPAPAAGSKPPPAAAPMVQVAAAEPPRTAAVVREPRFGPEQVAHFLAVALHDKDELAAVHAGQKDAARPLLLTRWKGAARLRVAGRNTAAGEALVQEAAAEIGAALEKAGGFALRAAEPANLLVYVLPSGPGDSPGYVKNAYDGAQIVGSTVVVYADKAGKAAALQLLLRALGLPGLDFAGRESVLAAAGQPVGRLTALDVAALTLLYSPELSPGMDVAAVRAAVEAMR